MMSTLNMIFCDMGLDFFKVKCTLFCQDGEKFRVAFRFRGWTHIMVINMAIGAMCLECPATKLFKYDKDDAIKGMGEAEAVHYALNIMMTAVYKDIAVIAWERESHPNSLKGE